MPLTRIESTMDKVKIPGCAATITATDASVATLPDTASTSQNLPPSLQNQSDIKTKPSSFSIPCSQNYATTTTTKVTTTSPVSAATIPTTDLVRMEIEKVPARGDNVISILATSNLSNNNSSININTSNIDQFNSSNASSDQAPNHVYVGTSRQTQDNQHHARSSHQVSNNQVISRQRPRMNLSDHLGQSLRTMYSTVSIDVPPSYHDIPGTVPSYHGRTSGPPPSYDDVINPNAPPPTYQSLFGQVMEARKTSNGLLDLLRRLLIILISTLGCTIIIGFLILIPFSMIIVGAIYLDDCHIENIPAFLLIGGSVWAIKNIISCYSQCKREPDYDFDAENRPRSGRYGSALNCFLFGWFIAGCVIVYRNYEPNYDDPNSLRYCNKTLYSYAFWLVTSTIVIFSLFVSCICCLMISSVIASHQDGDDPS